jgi:DNA-binding IclR family transcriptional regulator
MAQGSSTADKVLDVLLLFDAGRRELSTDQISTLIDAPRSTTYRYVRTLRDKGFLEKDDRGAFRLGPRILELAHVARRSLDIGDLALPVMEEIAATTRETVLLTRHVGRNAVCIERVEGPQTVRISFEHGQVQPLHAGASSKILLAYLDERLWDDYLTLPLERFTDHTITDPARLRNELQQIRCQGYCVSDGEVDTGARAVAVPILDQRGRLMAGLSTAGPTFRMDADVVQAHVAQLLAGAATVQERLAQTDR